MYWKRDVNDDFDVTFHMEQCHEGQETFKERFPEAEEEWSDKNFISTKQILYEPELDYKFLWNCKTCKLEYKRTLKQYVQGRKTTSCPYCRGTLPKPNESLAFLFPKVAKEFHYELNNSGYQEDNDDLITPEQLFPTNKSKAYFECAECGVIKAAPVGRYIEEECKYCKAGMTKEYSRWIYDHFFELNPGYEMQYINPETLEEKVFLCNVCGNDYSASVNDVFTMKDNCPYCAGTRAIPGKTSFKALYPEIERELINDNTVDFDTDKITPYFRKYTSYAWLCSECAQIWKASVPARVEGATCPYCACKLPIPGKTSFKALYPEIEKELIKDDTIDFDTDEIGLDFRKSINYKWLCSDCDQTWKASIPARIDGEICPYCDGRLPIPGKTSFKALYPEIERELIKDDTIDFDTDKIGLDFRKSIDYKWLCSDCDQTWKASIPARIDGETCPYCNGKIPHPSKTSLYATYKELIDQEWKFQSNVLLVNPRLVFPDSSKHVWWKCNKCQKSYYKMIKLRVRAYRRNKNICPYCKGRRRIKYRN